MSDKWDNQNTEELLKAILALKTIDEAKRCLRDLLTEAEILEFSRRWQAAKMLEKGVPYTQIVGKTGLSSTTVARVSQWLNSGLGGYKLVLKRLGLLRAQAGHHHNHSSG